MVPGTGIVLQVNSKIEIIEEILQSQLDKKLFRVKSLCMSLSRSAFNDFSVVRNFLFPRLFYVMSGTTISISFSSFVHVLQTDGWHRRGGRADPPACI